MWLTDLFTEEVRAQADLILTHFFDVEIHDRKMSVVLIDRRLYFPIAVPTPTVGDGRRTVGTTDMFL